MTPTNLAKGLTRDPGRPPRPVLATRILRAELRNGLRRLSLRLGLRKLHATVPEDWAIPDSDFAVRAIALATSLCPQFVIRHCFRSYCFGAILAARNQLLLDRETFFVAAMLHDLGLSDTHALDPGSFEWVGARLAHAFCIDAEQTEATAALVHEAIALHTSVGLADRCRPEIALLHFGTGLDLFGMRLDEVPEQALRDVLEAHSRLDFKAEFSPCLVHQAAQKPDSQIAGAVGVGITDRILEDLVEVTLGRQRH